MFGRKKTSENPSSDAAATAPVIETPEQTAARHQIKKGPTPTRAEREAARRRPLVPEDRKVARKAARDAEMAERQKMRLAMETGDERNMPLRDRGPQKRYARDWVDARTGVGEWLMVIVLVYVFMAFLPQSDIAIWLTFSLWAIVLLVVLEGVLISFQLKKRLTERFGEVERGVRWYGVMRAMQLRRLRLPKPQVKRGQFPA
ncbi:DUF3043 domain-containing protein [Citricoccus nitrophenolicus]|uniref:DUF3043 domain-containing protein n=1 Tax=Citricoccus nitrophenolicus TaxID=863575 RepID=A0ABV0ID70_9MICC|nr:DUF3043 domain-containing protein [Citricoccus sp. I39-566]WMY77462.1 DUF3043 domain-containing protein [Citricoccus sp. I39-566]